MIMKKWPWRSERLPMGRRWQPVCKNYFIVLCKELLLSCIERICKEKRKIGIKKSRQSDTRNRPHAGVDGIGMAEEISGVSYTEIPA